MNTKNYYHRQEFLCNRVLRDKYNDEYRGGAR